MRTMNGTCRSPVGNEFGDYGGSYVCSSVSAMSKGKSGTHGHGELATYATTPARIFASSLSTSTEWTTFLIVDAYHRPPLAVGTPSMLSVAAMAFSDLPSACS